ncbi:hypothetical protein DYBT9275_02253 [Dyadobacter sp. CECT 9275]|uniref:Uncharacterized protein n=1 Tax=Dyadobacter helix TaxID=2822344 RepID=A0A916NC43_9BACT|nr:hypothetical protein [Dyadobacter sp. CECT 9275]CAG4999560.1 hypothetical protein DYBT9275_02253 [Dyadobacter sp. CECT 9275]
MHGIFKYLGLLLVVTGMILIITDKSVGSEIPLLAGLFILFVSKGKTEDERAIILKSSSAYIALMLGYGIKLISTNLYVHQVISFQLTEINHFLIMVFALANGIYYLRLNLSF